MTTDWTTGVRSLKEAKDYSFSLAVQAIPEAHSASYPTSAGDYFPEIKRGGA
jgi:hypothetical protein